MEQERSVPTEEPEAESHEMDVGEAAEYESAVVLHRPQQRRRDWRFFFEPPGEALNFFDGPKLFRLIEPPESEISDLPVAGLRRHGPRHRARLHNTGPGRALASVESLGRPSCWRNESHLQA